MKSKKQFNEYLWFLSVKMCWNPQGNKFNCLDQELENIRTARVFFVTPCHTSGIAQSILIH